MVPKPPFKIGLFKKWGQKTAKNHVNRKTKGTFSCQSESGHPLFEETLILLRVYVPTENLSYTHSRY